MVSRRRAAEDTKSIGYNKQEVTWKLLASG